MITDTEHLLLVEVNDGEREYTIEHSDTCPTERSTIFDTVSYEVPICMTAAMIDMAGFEDVAGIDDLAPGRYRVKAWYMPQHWAGADPIDAEGGIEVLGPVSSE